MSDYRPTDLRTRSSYATELGTWSGANCPSCGTAYGRCKRDQAVLHQQCCNACRLAGVSANHDEQQEEIPMPEPKTTAELAEQALQPAEDPRLPDPELEVIRAVLDAIEPLDRLARARVLSYCQARTSAVPHPPQPPWVQAPEPTVQGFW